MCGAYPAYGPSHISCYRATLPQNQHPVPIRILRIVACTAASTLFPSLLHDPCFEETMPSKKINHGEAVGSDDRPGRPTNDDSTNNGQDCSQTQRQPTNQQQVSHRAEAGPRVATHRPSSVDVAAVGMNSIITPQPDDILMGRGLPYQSHPGNQKMRSLADENKQRYNSLPRSNRGEIANELLRFLKNSGSRFLVRKENAPKKSFSEGWEIASDADAYEKVCHALRAKCRQTNAAAATTTTTSAENKQREVHSYSDSAGSSSLRRNHVADKQRNRTSQKMSRSPNPPTHNTRHNMLATDALPNSFSSNILPNNPLLNLGGNYGLRSLPAGMTGAQSAMASGTARDGSEADKGDLRPEGSLHASSTDPTATQSAPDNSSSGDAISNDGSALRDQAVQMAVSAYLDRKRKG